MKNIVFKVLRYSGLSFVFRELMQRHKVSILMFHDANVENAAKAFSYLQKHYHIISLREYMEAVKTGSKLPPKALILTFDDGHVGNYNLLPVIQQLQIPVTIFLCSDIVGTRRHFWFCHNDELLPERQHMKRLPNHLRLDALKKYGFDQMQEYPDVHALNREQIEEMKPWVDFQSHTCFHPCLPQCDDETAKAEIAISKQHLERDFGLDIYSISYPNGDYTQRDIDFAKEAGYACGITVDYGFNDIHSDLFRLKRISVNDARSLDELIVKASGCYAFMKRLFK